MKKSTGIFLIISFFLLIFVLLILFISLVMFAVKGTTPNLLHGKRLALVRVEGTIYDVDNWVKEIKSYQEDTSIKGIILRVNSPGGAMGPSQELYDVIKESQDKYNKVVVASFASIAASGGYYIAASADRIVSTPGTLTGSIGVYSKFIKMKELFEKVGINYETVKAGKYKDFGSMERGLTEEERSMMQGVIDDSYMQFVEAIISGRKKALSQVLLKWTPDKTSDAYPYTSDVTAILKKFYEEQKLKQEKAAEESAKMAARIVEATEITKDATGTIESASGVVNNASAVTPTPNETSKNSSTLRPDDATILAFAKSLAEGKIYTGRQAKAVGLVDELGSLEDAIQLTAKLVGISGEPTVVEKKYKESSIFDLLSQKMSALTNQKVESPIRYEYEP